MSKEHHFLIAAYVVVSGVSAVGVCLHFESINDLKQVFLIVTTIKVILSAILGFWVKIKTTNLELYERLDSITEEFSINLIDQC